MKCPCCPPTKSVFPVGLIILVVVIYEAGKHATGLTDILLVILGVILSVAVAGIVTFIYLVTRHHKQITPVRVIRAQVEPATVHEISSRILSLGSAPTVPATMRLPDSEMIPRNKA